MTPSEQSRIEEILGSGIFSFNRCVRPDGSAYGTGGQCRKGIPQDKPPEEPKAQRSRGPQLPPTGGGRSNKSKLNERDQAALKDLIEKLRILDIKIGKTTDQASLARLNKVRKNILDQMAGITGKPAPKTPGEPKTPKTPGMPTYRRPGVRVSKGALYQGAQRMDYVTLNGARYAIQQLDQGFDKAGQFVIAKIQGAGKTGSVKIYTGSR